MNDIPSCGDRDFRRLDGRTQRIRPAIGAIQFSVIRPADHDVLAFLRKRFAG